MICWFTCNLSSLTGQNKSVDFQFGLIFFLFFNWVLNKNFSRILILFPLHVQYHPSTSMFSQFCVFFFSMNIICLGVFFFQFVSFIISAWCSLSCLYLICCHSLFLKSCQLFYHFKYFICSILSSLSDILSIHMLHNFKFFHIFLSILFFLFFLLYLFLFYNFQLTLFKTTSSECVSSTEEIIQNIHFF